MTEPVNFASSPTMRRALAESFRNGPDSDDLQYLAEGGDDGDWEIWQVGQSRYEDDLFSPDAA